MDKKAQIDGPVAVIILLTIALILLAFLYPILNPIISWFVSLSIIIKLGLLLFIFSTAYILIKEYRL